MVLRAIKGRALSEMWTTQLLTLAAAVFLARLGQGLMNGVATNFYVDTLNLTGSQVLWLTSVREVPGLLLVFLAAAICYLPLVWRAAGSLLLMGVGFGLYATTHSYAALLAMVVVASIGFHNWGPTEGALALGMVGKERSGRVLGSLASVGSLASIVGVGLAALLSSNLSLRAFYVVGGAIIVLGAAVVLRLPRSTGHQAAARASSRIILRRRYWLYYVLTFFEGTRTQVFGAFGTLVLVEYYGLRVGQISALLAGSMLLNFLLAPYFGRLLDRVGERIMLTTSYVALALCFVGYATVHNAWFLAGMLLGINLLITLRIGLSAYVNRIAPPEDLSATLSAGVSVNHISSVSVSLLAGALLEQVGYEVLCWGAVGMILLSVPFAWSLRVGAPEPDAAPAGAG
jgi:predicted MFS family arabinose efflux permease